MTLEHMSVSLGYKREFDPVKVLRVKVKNMHVTRCLCDCAIICATDTRKPLLRPSFVCQSFRISWPCRLP